MYKVLIVDDEPLAVMALHQGLRQRLPMVDLWETAGNGLDAVDIARVFQPNVAILDVEMPGLDGLELGRILAEQLPQCHLLYLTAYGTFDYAVRALRAGAADYFLKPVDVGRLADKIHGLLTGHPVAAATGSTAAPASEVTAAAEAAEAERDDPEFRAKVAAYLNGRFKQAVTLDQIAVAFHLHPSVFSRKFKRCFGCNFLTYLAELRLNFARDLLCETDFSVKRVALESGYIDPDYFARQFRRQFGVTPTQFKKTADRCGRR